MIDKTELRKTLSAVRVKQTCRNCEEFTPTNPYMEENSERGLCNLDDYSEFFEQEYNEQESCNKNPIMWGKRKTHHPNYAYGCINQCPECGRWSYFIHDMNIDDCITENEGFCSYCGRTQVED